MTGRWRSRSTTRVSRQGPVKPSMWSRCAGFVLRTGFCRPRSRRSLLGNSRSLTSRHDSGSRRVPCIIGSLKASSRLGAILAGAGACRSPRTLRRRVVNGCSLRCTSNSQPKRALWEVQFEVTVPALEDKIVQRATVEVLNAIYETDFLGFSYGFRPGRSQHNALDALYTGLLTKKVNWVLDVDIRGFFDAIDHGWLVQFVEHRIADRRVVRLIQKWLNAGVLEEGKRTRAEEGTPQGGSASPLLANLYLHYAFDLWVQVWRRTRARGDVIVVRFADDSVLGFQVKADAERFWTELTERVGKFRLELHPEKTRLLEFGPYAAENRKRLGQGKPETVNFLGFTHICGKKRSNGRFTVLRQTIRKRLQAKLSEVKAELRRRLHDPIPEVGEWLRSVVVGHIRYYGVPMNGPALHLFRFQVGGLWHRALSRRSQNGRVHWDRMRRLIDRWLPPARIYHPYPLRRLGVIT